MHTVCCYPETAGLIEALAAQIAPVLRQASAAGKPRLLFSAHGLPKRVVDSENIVEDLALGRELSERAVPPMLVEDATVSSPPASASAPSARAG